MKRIRRARWVVVLGVAWASLFSAGLAVAQTTTPGAAGAPVSPALPPPPATATTATTTTATASSDTTPTNIRLRTLEQKVEALKEQAWRVKARVGMLKEAVLGTGIGARATITHQNKMGGSFRLTKLIYALDGQQIFARVDEDTSKLNDLKAIDILSGPIAPGNHTISVLMEYHGNGYGVFAYLKQYKFTVRSSHTFTVTEGKQTQLTVVGYEKGNITTQLKDRPAVDFKVNVISDRPAGAGK
jgi:hypothetical protein